MQKIASKNIIPSKSNEFLKIGVAIQFLKVRELQSAISNRVQKVHSLDTMHVRNLKSGSYLPCMYGPKIDKNPKLLPYLAVFRPLNAKKLSQKICVTISKEDTYRISSS